MRKEIIKVRDDGTKVKIIITFNALHWNTSFTYSVDVNYLPPRKKKWLDTWSSDDFEYRKSLNRPEFIKEKILQYCTEEEILATKLALWETLKPT